MRSRRVYHHEAGLSPRRVSGSKCRGFVARSLRRCACHPRATSLFDHIDLYLPSVRNWPFSHSRSLFQAVMHESKFFDLASAVSAAQTFSGVYSTKIISSCRIRRTQGVDDGEKSSSTGADRVGYLRVLWIDDGPRQGPDACDVDTGGYADRQAQSEYRVCYFRPSVNGVPLQPEPAVPAAGL